MRSLLIVLVTMLAAACATGPERVSIASDNPFAQLKPDTVTAIHAAYEAPLVDAPAGGDDIIFTCSDCPPKKYRYVRCTMVSAFIGEFMQYAVLAKSTVPHEAIGEMLYSLELEIVDAPSFTGYLFANGEIYLGNDGKTLGPYQLDAATSKSLVSLIKGPKWTCEKTVIIDEPTIFVTVVTPDP